uniref:MATH domain-containing protein n=1 Tax=Clytia hemisphaerica TaxID=252671 RepID=A0A7M5WZX4_9CNID
MMLSEWMVDVPNGCGWIRTVSEFESVDEHITRNALLHAKMFSEHYKANETKHQQEKTDMVNQIKGLQLELHSTKEKFTQTTRQMQQEFENKIEEFQKVLQVKLSEVEAIKARGPSGGDGTVMSAEMSSGIHKEIKKTRDDVTQMNKTVSNITHNLADVDLRHQLHENTTFDGHMIWKIDNFETRYQQAVIGKTTALHSAPSFTSRYGYKFCARLYLNGDGMGKGTHVSLFFVLMKSEFDTLLEWPFNKKVTFTLINQENQERNVVETFNADVNSSSFKKPTKHMNIASGCPYFVSQEKLKKPNSGFIKDGCFFLEIKLK